MDVAMKCGVVCAGGTGSRLMPLTKATNKHLLPVYNIPMIYAPINTLKSMGCTDIIVVAGGDHVGDIASVLEDGSELEISISYRVQKEPNGIGGAIQCAEGYVNGLFPVILGDNYFYTPPHEVPETPTIYTKFIWEAKQFGVYDLQNNRIVEKPLTNISRHAVTGLYIYDDAVFDFVKSTPKSDRGEYEVTDLNNLYLEKGNMKVIKYEDEWEDMGGFEGLYAATQLEREKAWR
jgi:glucose-1-phosphate thymidylyltransferase